MFDPHHPLRGKKRFDPGFRPVRSKINIKISAPEATIKKRENKITVEQGVIDDFNKKYAENCDQRLMRVKHRNVSKESPFDPKNKPPDQYLRPDNVIDKPCKIDLSKLDASKIPLAGKLGRLGEKILSDFKNARQFTDYDWHTDCLMTEQIPRAVLGKKATQPITAKLNEIDMSNVDFAKQNFANLHQSAQFPGAPNPRSSRIMNMTAQLPFNKNATAHLSVSQSIG